MNKTGKGKMKTSYNEAEGLFVEENKTLKEISDLLLVSVTTLSGWKIAGNWDEKRLEIRKKGSNATRVEAILLEKMENGGSITPQEVHFLKMLKGLVVPEVSKELAKPENSTVPLDKFMFNGRSVRIELINEQPWWCLKDVCDILGVENSRRVASEMLKEKGVRKTYTLSSGGKQEMLFVDESNLYRCIFRSRKPEAEKFTDWVTEEVLPAIRKTGGYHILDNELNMIESRISTIHAEVRKKLKEA